MTDLRNIGGVILPKNSLYWNKQNNHHSQSHSLDFFLLHLLTLTALFFFSNDVEISVLKQVETGSSSSGNKSLCSLCFSSVSLRHRGGYWPGITTNGWKLPEEPPPHTHTDIGELLPRSSLVSCMSWNWSRPDALDSWHQDGKIDCHIILFILLREICSCVCTCTTPHYYVEAIMHWSASALEYLHLITQYRCRDSVKEDGWRYSQSVISVSGKSIFPSKHFHVYSFMRVSPTSSTAVHGWTTVIFKCCAGALNLERTCRYGLV